MERCRIEECGEAIDSRGYCRIHNLCSVEGCGRVYTARGYCVTHYKRFMRGQDVNATIKRYTDWNNESEDFKCRVDGCDKTVESNGQGGYFKYCGMHRTRLKKYGSLDIYKVCANCESSYNIEETKSDIYCAKCYKIYCLCTRVQNTHKDKGRSLVHAKYSITPFQWYEIYKDQKGRCKLCKTRHQLPYRWRKKSDALAVDHDHNCCGYNRSCGKCIRGLLCHPCNLILGHYEKHNGKLTIPEFDKYLLERVVL